MSRRLALCVVALLATGCASPTAAPLAVSGPPSAEQRVGLGEWDIRTEGRPLSSGPVRLTVTNTGAAPHDLVLEAGGVRAATRVLRPGESAVLEATLPAGEPATLWCSVAGHRAQGMELELPVRAPGDAP